MNEVTLTLRSVYQILDRQLDSSSYEFYEHESL